MSLPFHILRCIQHGYRSSGQTKVFKNGYKVLYNEPRIVDKAFEDMCEARYLTRRINAIGPDGSNLWCQEYVKPEDLPWSKIREVWENDVYWGTEYEQDFDPEDIRLKVEYIIPNEIQKLWSKS